MMLFNIIKKKGVLMEDKGELTEIAKIIDQMAANWGSNIVARKEIGRFSGGILSPKTLANMDSKGEGPEGRFIICNQTAYPIQKIIKFMKDRVAEKWQKKTPIQRKKI
jgi:hypothetical protein